MVHPYSADDTTELRRQHDRAQADALIERRKRRRAAGQPFDVALLILALVTVGWAVWAYQQTDNASSPIYRNIVTIGALLTTAGVGVRMIERGNNRRSAEADLIQSVEYQRLRDAERAHHLEQMTAIEEMTRALRDRSEDLGAGRDARLRALEEQITKRVEEMTTQLADLDARLAEDRKQEFYAGYAQCEQEHLSPGVPARMLLSKQGQGEQVRQSSGSPA